MPSVDQLAQFAPLCDAAALAPALEAACAWSGIDTPLRQAHWLAQLSVESAGFTRFTEALGYSAERLCAVWPSRFPNLVAATPFAHNPQALADKVYDGRMGNVEPGDGWRFHGRGLIQITGRDNYHRYGTILGVDLVGDPDLAAQPATAARIAGAFWSDHGLNARADADDVEGITRAINGGLTGLADRQAALGRAKIILGAV